MIDEDIESPEAWEDQEEEKIEVQSAIRCQNRWLICALSMCFVGTALFIGASQYSSPAELPLDAYDESGGTVGENAVNGKSQYALDKENHDSPDHNPWRFPETDHFSGGKTHNISDLLAKHKNITAMRMQGMLNRWNRTHPGEPLPSRYNLTASPFLSWDSYLDHMPRDGPSTELPTRTKPMDSDKAKDRHHDSDPIRDKVSHDTKRTMNTTKEDAHVGSSVAAAAVEHQTSTIVESNHSDNATLENSNSPDVEPLVITESKPPDAIATTTTSSPEPVPDKVPDHEEPKMQTDQITDAQQQNTMTEQEIQAWHAGHVDMNSGIKFEIVDQLEHDRKAFTQGLTYANGKLYESTGLYGQSTVRVLDPATAKVQQSVPMESKYFGEGMTIYKDKLVQIVWKLATGFVYDANDITAPPVKYTYKTTKRNEGWGITYDNDRDELIVTDGSANIIFWDPECWKSGHCAPKADKPPIQVLRLDGSPAEELNEIEYWRGRLLANIWYSDVLLVIHPETGKVEKEYDFGPIFPENTRPQDADVFNGISISDHPDILYVTGKKWDRMFKVRLLSESPPAFAAQIPENDDKEVQTDQSTDVQQSTEAPQSIDAPQSTAVQQQNTMTEQEIQAWHAGHVDMNSGIKFEIVDQLEHDRKAFTQGLTYANGKLYESTGLYGQSTVRVLDPATAKVQQSVPMESKYFGEGMTIYKDKLVQIVWKLATGFVYDANDITAPPVKYTYKTTKRNEGWGITYDNDRDELIVTDGSANIIFWDPECWKSGHCAPKADKPPIQVLRLDGSPAEELNEIEYWRGRLLANIWYSDVLLVIHPETGKVEKEYDFGPIFPENTRPQDADVFNGISISDHPDILYVTGKKWDRMFKVRLLSESPPAFAAQIPENDDKEVQTDQSTDVQQSTEAPQSIDAPQSTAVQQQNTMTEQEIQAWHAGHVDMNSGIKFEIVDQLEHDRKAFTQGLTYANGKLYESTGLYGQSTVRVLDPATAKVQQSVPMESKYFGEGMTIYKDKLVQIVWKLATGFVYDANDITAPPVKYTYKTTKRNEGWGITYDNDRDELIVTDGSANIIFWDPECWKSGHCAPKADKPPIQVLRLNGKPAEELNEIEYWRGRLLANIWYSDVLLVIHPETGKVEKEYDFGPIFPKNTRPHDADVFNGISVSDHPDIMYVTGKKWDRMFKVKLLI